MSFPIVHSEHKNTSSRMNCMYCVIVSASKCGYVSFCMWTGKEAQTGNIDSNNLTIECPYVFFSDIYLSFFSILDYNDSLAFVRVLGP